MRVLEWLGGANDWRGGRIMLKVELETDVAKCARCGLAIGRGRVAFFLHEPPAPARIEHPRGKCPSER